MGAVSAFRTPARPSQRDVKAVAGAAIAQTEHVQDIIQRGIIPAITAAQGALEVEAIHREAGDAALDARLRVHRCDIDSLSYDYRAADSALIRAHDALRLRVEGFVGLTFLGRLRWLLTGKVR